MAERGLKREIGSLSRKLDFNKVHPLKANRLTRIRQRSEHSFQQIT